MLNHHIFNIETFSKNSIFNEKIFIDCEHQCLSIISYQCKFNHIFNIDILSTNIQFLSKFQISIVGAGGLEPPVSGRTDLQSARLPITGYAPNQKCYGTLLCLSHIFNIVTFFINSIIIENIFMFVYCMNNVHI